MATLLIRAGAFALLSFLASEIFIVDLEKKSIAAFDRYVLETERGMDDRAKPFLRVDGIADAKKKTKALESLRKGELIIESLETRANGRDIDVPDAIVHHWLGVVFVPGKTVSQAVALLQDYDHHQDIYKPNVARSKTVSRAGDRFTVYLRFFMDKGLTVVVNSDHDAVFTREAADRASSRIRSTRIAEVEEPGTPTERERPVGHDHGFLWRLNSYWRFLERDGGVYVQCESITLTRDIPFGFGVVVGSYTNRIPKETLTFTLEATRKELARRSAQAGGRGVEGTVTGSSGAGAGATPPADARRIASRRPA